MGGGGREGRGGEERGGERRVGGVGRGVAEGYAPYMGFGWWECAGGGVWDRGEVGMRRESFEGLFRGVRGDTLTCRGHPYLFFTYILNHYVINK